MAQGSVERRVWINSASGYVRSILRIVLGILSFRALCTKLSAEEFGFYGLVWSLLGYGVLFDLGMGVAVQKTTAEAIARKDWPELSRVLSSVLFCGCTLAVVIFGVGWLISEPLLRSIGASPENLSNFRWSLRIFIVGMAAMFPLQMFREVHYGQQRIAFAEHASTVVGIISFGLLLVALRMNWSLSAILGMQVACLVVMGAVLMVSALRAMPEVRIRLQYVSWRVLRSIAKFSALAYVTVIAGILVLQTDRILVGIVLSVSTVAAYHIAAKVSEIFAGFTRQLPEALAPEAAALHGAGHRTSWQWLFVRGMRLNALVATPLFLLCALFFEGLLALFTRGQSQNVEIVFLGELLLCWSYSTMLTHGVSKAVFLMSGQESRLVRLLVLEAFVNLVSSLLLLQWLKSPLGAALGSLVPALVVGWGLLWPWSAREIGMTSANLLRETLVPALRAAIPLLAFGLLCRTIPTLDFKTNQVAFFAEATFAAFFAAAGTWHFGFTADDRAAVLSKFGQVPSSVRSIDS